MDIKVALANDPLRVTGGKTKQDIVISDDTSTARLTLWEDRVNTMFDGDSYALRNVVVRQFRGTKYLSMAKSGSTITGTDDIGATIEYDPECDDLQRRELQQCIIIAVLSLDTYKACLSCKARVEATEQSLGICSKCSLMQRIDKCVDQLSAKLMLQEQNGTITTLSAFGTLLQQMSMVPVATDVTQETLLKAPPLQTITYNDKNVATGIKRLS